MPYEYEAVLLEFWIINRQSVRPSPSLKVRQMKAAMQCDLRMICVDGKEHCHFLCCQMLAVSLGSKFEAEIREEKEERKRQEVEKKQRQAAFKQLQSTFCS